MKTLVTTICALLVSLSIYSQANYEKGMQQAFDLWGAQKNNDASNLFERIAKAEKENWLPYYYVALVNTTGTFLQKDRSNVPAKLEKAQEYANLAGTFSESNVEVLVLQALIHTAEMLQDGSKAQTLAPKIEGIYQKALEIAPKNPRVVANFADWKVGSARYFKQDITPYCDALKKALLLFKSDKPSEPFGPTWGKERTQQLIKECEQS